MNNGASLKRSLRLPAVTLYGVGAILGAGIYVLIGEIAGLSGYFTPLSFLLAAVVAVFSAFSYAELSARFPRSAGEAVYIDEAFAQPYLTLLIGLLVVFTGIVSASTMATGVVGYIQRYVDLPTALIISIFVISIGAIVQLIMASRVIYGMAKSRLIPQSLSIINSHTSTPVRATLLCIAISLMLALVIRLGILAQATSVILLTIFMLVNLALIRINSISTDSGSIHYPRWVPYVGALLCITILVMKTNNLLSTWLPELWKLSA